MVDAYANETHVKSRHYDMEQTLTTSCLQYELNMLYNNKTGTLSLLIACPIPPPK